MTDSLVVRDYQDSDWPQLWPIIEQVVRAGDTFPFDPAMSEDTARSIWVESAPGRTTVAVDPSGVVLGTAKMGTNRPGPGSHVSTASYMVPAAARGRGVGRALVIDSLDWAREKGYAAMQFNAVVANNVAAVTLYEDLGFAVVGTVPEAFEHPVDGRVGLHVMHIRL
ncbi:MAG TPA: GNAT family N-acetyltransferase [Dermatophilaceae bacterium]|nr:GNAT family N-acetyltransferase [Dermatophilaceae bacterium]